MSRLDGDRLKRELETLGMRLVRRAAGHGDDGKAALQPDALEVFRVVGTWEVANRKVRDKDKPEDDAGTFSALKSRIISADHREGNA